ncbi:MAG: PaaI family thioesterase [Alphaproteobacteria bacterium]|nr:PaaI family thioesterase [Alphaproteobacteria bacterium]
MTGEAAAPPPGYQHSEPADPYEDAIGPFYVRVTPEGPIYAFSVTEKHMNMSGNAHGGMLGCFADTIFRLAAGSANDGAKVTPLSMSLSFMAAARAGDLVECRPEVIRRTAGTLFVSGSFNVGGVIIFSASSLWETLRTPPETAKNV